MRYQLIATNKQGASVVFWGRSQAEAIRGFDHEYTRKGFTIEIIDTHNFRVCKRIKTTYR